MRFFFSTVERPDRSTQYRRRRLSVVAVTVALSLFASIGPVASVSAEVPAATFPRPPRPRPIPVPPVEPPPNGSIRRIPFPTVRPIPLPTVVPIPRPRPTSPTWPRPTLPSWFRDGSFGNGTTSSPHVASAFPTTRRQFDALYSSAQRQSWIDVFIRFNDETRATEITSLADLVELREQKAGRLVFVAHSTTDDDGGRRIAFPDGTTYSEQHVIDVAGPIQIGTCRPDRACDNVTPREIKRALGAEPNDSDELIVQIIQSRQRKKRLHRLLASGSSVSAKCEFLTGAWHCGLFGPNGDDDDE